MRAANPITPFLDGQGVLVLDGGLATELERRGHSLDDPLWSARLLVDDPEAIVSVHRDYLEAGADAVVSASYQATPRGFVERGLTEAQADRLLLVSVDLARRARDAFWDEAHPGRLKPLVAASIGPYGAYLANGAEYTGDYGLSETALVEFHRRRWHVLAESQADLFACETIPSKVETAALVRLLSETPDVLAWVSFSCRDGKHVSDGTAIEEAAGVVTGHPQVVAVGVNCTAPRYVRELIERVRSVTDKPVVTYPNSGEGYDAASRTWQGEPSAQQAKSDPEGLSALCLDWRGAGARLIGGCCRTGPEHIRRMRARLLS